MSPKRDKRRTSILKKRRSNEDEITESTISKIQKKTHFSQKNQVKEFRECSERLTIWGNSYETSALKSDGSSCGDATQSGSHSKIIGSAFMQKSSAVAVSAFAIPEQELEKENIIRGYPGTATTKPDEERLSVDNHSNENSMRSSIELTLFVERSEKNRLGKYGAESLNITTNLGLDSSNKSLLNHIAGEHSKVLSPRKMIFNNKSNVSVVIKDKVLLNAPSTLEDKVSFSIESDEERSGDELNRPRAVRIASSKASTLNANARATKKKSFEAHKAVVFTTPTAFQSKSRLAQSTVGSTRDEPKSEIDDLFKLIVSDTPLKSLCRLNNCCTPTHSNNKVVFTAQRPNFAANKSINLLEEFENIEKDKAREAHQGPRSTIFHNDAIDIETNNEHKTIFRPTAIQVVLNTPQQTRRTITFNDSMQLDIESHDAPRKDHQFANKPESTGDAEKVFNDVSSMVIAKDSKMANSNRGEERVNAKLQADNWKTMRKSVIVNETMQLEDSSNLPDEIIAEAKVAMARKTVFHDDSIKFDGNNYLKMPTCEPIDSQQSRRTVVFNDSIQLEDEQKNQATDDTRRSWNTSMRNVTDFNFEDIIGDDTNNSTEKLQMYIKSLSRKSVITHDATMQQSIEEDACGNKNSLEEFELIEQDTAKTPRKAVVGKCSSNEDDRNFNRKTIFEASAMQIDHHHNDVPDECVKRALKSRKTIVFDETMQLDGHDSASYDFLAKGQYFNQSTDRHELNGAALLKNNVRQTIFESTSMHISDNSVEMDSDLSQHNTVKSRKTIVFNESIQSEGEGARDDDTKLQQQNHSQANNPPELDEMRHNATMDTSCGENYNLRKSSAINCSPSKRKTVYHNDSIELEEGITRGTIFERFPKQQVRKTIVLNDSMHVENDQDLMTRETYRKHRQTINQPETIVIEDAKSFSNNNTNTKTSSITEDHKFVPMSRPPLREVSESAARRAALQNESTQLNAPIDRQTIFQHAPMQLAVAAQKVRETITTNDSMEVENDESRFQRQTINQAECIDTDDDDEKTVDNYTLSNTTNIRVEDEEDQSQKSAVTNESIQVDDEDYTECIMRDAASFASENMSYRPTIFGIATSEVNRRMTYTKDEPMAREVDRRKTYTKEESMRWHNITDKEMLNMIDDESNPCLNSVEHLDSINPISTEHSAMTIYENAVEDFVNITIVESPLNGTLSRSRMGRQSRIPSPIKDYDTMLENLASDLKKKDKPKPRLEIDEYLEKLQIEQVKIPRYPQNDYKHLVDKMSEKFARHREQCSKKSTLANECEFISVQFPQTPTAKFLMKNLIESMEEELIKTIRVQKGTITPVFPETIDFEILLRNKFDSDEMLVKFWNLDTLFWWKGSFKLTHWKMPMFTINFSSQQTNEEVSESTIPVIFKDVSLYLNAEYRLSANDSRRNVMLRHEFSRTLNMTNNFTSICNSSRELFTFLDLYHEHVMRTIQLVENFLKILLKYEAVYSQHPKGFNNVIRKIVFFEDDWETVVIKIAIENYIEDVSVKDLIIEGQRFTYCLLPRGSFEDMRGLMLIELLLYNPEKFLHENTTRQPIAQ